MRSWVQPTIWGGVEVYKPRPEAIDLPRCPRRIYGVSCFFPSQSGSPHTGNRCREGSKKRSAIHRDQLLDIQSGVGQICQMQTKAAGVELCVRFPRVSRSLADDLKGNIWTTPLFWELTWDLSWVIGYVQAPRVQLKELSCLCIPRFPRNYHQNPHRPHCAIPRRNALRRLERLSFNILLLSFWATPRPYLWGHLHS